MAAPSDMDCAKQNYNKKHWALRNRNVHSSQVSDVEISTRVVLNFDFVLLKCCPGLKTGNVLIRLSVRGNLSLLGRGCNMTFIRWKYFFRGQTSCLSFGAEKKHRFIL